jgi:hypothetical protein
MMCNLCAAFGKSQTVKSDEPESNEQGQKTGEGIQLTHRGNNSSHQGSSSARTEAAVEGSHNGKRGMVLPFDQHSITFDDIIYSVDMPQVTYIINIWN